MFGTKATLESLFTTRAMKISVTRLSVISTWFFIRVHIQFSGLVEPFHDASLDRFSTRGTLLTVLKQPKVGEQLKDVLTKQVEHSISCFYKRNYWR